MVDHASDLDVPAAADVLVLDDERFASENVSIVTGAASGIGRATALAQAMNGLTVVGTDVDEDGLATTVDLADDLGAPGEVVTAPGNLTNEDDIAAEGEGKLRAFTLSTSYLRTPLVENQISDTARERGITGEEVIEDVMLGGSRVREMMEPVEAANVFTFGFSKHGKHLDISTAATCRGTGARHDV